MKRGEIWTVAGGPACAGKPRPAVIVQDDRFDANDSIIVCPSPRISHQHQSSDFPSSPRLKADCARRVD